jgi:hypothetical protein
MRTLPVVVTLSAPLFDQVEPAQPAASLRIEQELCTAAEECGLTIRPEARFEPATGPLRGQHTRVSVDGRQCLLPSTVSAQALAYATGASEVPMVVDGELGVPRPEAEGGATPDQLHEMLALICRATVAARPEVLVPEDDPLGRVLGLGVSIAGQEHDSLREEALEGNITMLLDRLTAPTVELLVEPTYLRELTSGRDGGGDLFSFMRDGLFVELGIVIPRMHVRLDPSLHPRGFAFRINSVRTVPRIGLALDTIYVNDTPERLEFMSVSGTLSSNPATAQPGAIVPAASKQELEAAGLTVWDPFGYYILALASDLRARARALLSPNRVRKMLELLGAAFPAVTGSIPESEVDTVLTPLLRDLLADRISVRNLPRIVDLMRRHVVAPELADGLDLTSFVRAGLADTIGNTSARGTNTLVVYLLEPAFDQELAGRSRSTVNPTVAEDLREAIHTELVHLPATAQVPALLTTEPSRVAARDVICDEFPAIRVLSYPDIPPDYNVQPVARISR